MLRLIRLFAFAFVSTFAATAAFGQAGYVHELSGAATIQAKSGKPIPLKVGDLVNAGQMITTADKSSAVVKFEDGQVMALNAATSFSVDTYRYNKKEVAASNAAFSLIKGGLRFISGVIGSTNRNAFKITAATATIGIRGTDGIIVLDAVTQIVTAAVNAGAVALSTPLGTQTVNAGAFTSFSRTEAPPAPRPVAAMAVAAPVVAAVLNTLAQKTNIPVNTPVVVVTSARAAVAQAVAQQAQAQAAANPQNQALQQRAAQATAQAAQALNLAVQAAVVAFAQAIQAGAVTPAAAAPPATIIPPPPPPKPAAEAPKPAPKPAAETPKPAPTPTPDTTQQPAPTTAETTPTPTPTDTTLQPQPTTTTTTTTSTSGAGAGGAGGGGSTVTPNTCGAFSASPC